MAAAKGGWPVCDPVLRLAGAAYSESKETSTTVCGDEGRCVVCNLRKAGCSKIAYCCTTVRGDKGRCVVCNLRKAGCSLIAYCCTTVCGDKGRCVVCILRKAGCSLITDCCNGDRQEIERDARGLAGGHATPRLYREKYYEGASWTFCVKYTEYKKRVAHANAQRAIQREVVSMAELITSHVQKDSARVYHCLLYTSPSPRD